MSKCIVTAYDSNISNCLGVSRVIENKENYCKKYGWKFFCFTNGFDKSKPPAFSKIKFILECLEQCDLVLWNDFDCIFTNFKIDISQGLKEDEYIGALEEKTNYFCTGNILIRSNDFTKTFFLSLKDVKSWENNNHPWEQTSFNDKIALLNYEHIKRFKINEFGAWNEEGIGKYIIRPWQQGDFILHLGAGSGRCIKITWQERIDLFLNVYRNLIIY